MTSKKLTVRLFPSTMIFKSLSRKTLHILFLIFSISRSLTLKAASPSSRYKPMVMAILFGEEGQKVASNQFTCFSSIKRIHGDVELVVC